MGKRNRTEHEAATRTVVYIRVSTNKQADHGVSLETQEAKARAYAELYDLELVAVKVDAGVSAKTLERPALQEALGLLTSGQAEALLVIKLDRLTRSVRDLGELVERYFSSGRWSLMSVSENIDTRTAASRLVLNVLASVAQWEREATGERTSAAMAYKASKGEFTGGEPPYGFRLGADGVHLEEHPEEQVLLNAARDLREAGMSLRAVAAELARRGFRSRKGKGFSASQVKCLLKGVA